MGAGGWWSVSDRLASVAVCVVLSAATMQSTDCDGGPRDWAACGRGCELGQEVSVCVLFLQGPVKQKRR